MIETAITSARGPRMIDSLRGIITRRHYSRARVVIPIRDPENYSARLTCEERRVVHTATLRSLLRSTRLLNYALATTGERQVARNKMLAEQLMEIYMDVCAVTRIRCCLPSGLARGSKITRNLSNLRPIFSTVSRIRRSTRST